MHDCDCMHDMVIMRTVLLCWGAPRAASKARAATHTKAEELDRPAPAPHAKPSQPTTHIPNAMLVETLAQKDFPVTYGP